MQSNWREVLSWNNSIYNPPEHQDGLRRLIIELDKKGIPHKSILSPSGYRKVQAILIEKGNVSLYVEYFHDDNEYHFYKKGWKWINSRGESSISLLIEDIESEL